MNKEIEELLKGMSFEELLSLSEKIRSQIAKEKYDEESKPYTTITMEEVLRLKSPKYSYEEKEKKLSELRKKWDYEIDFSDW